MYRLIVIDDDIDAVNSISKNFPWEQFGFCLINSFQDGISALAWLKTHTVEVILCDIKMPRMNGIELARQMQLRHRRERIIFISGFKDFEYARKALEYHVCSYCIKPVTFREMQKTIQKIREDIDQERSVIPSEDVSSISEMPSPIAEPRQSITDVKIEQIRMYISRYYASITLRQLAGFMQMNTTYLSHYFKDKTGQNLFGYITEVRLNAALTLLKAESHLNLTEVAEKVGYTNTVSFSRSFKNQFGVTPTDVRRDFSIVEAHK
ncbi:MAG: response regulator [Eubacteriales bacterium]|nr:response regulator [Eubacteriales bacterium]